MDSNHEQLGGTQDSAVDSSTLEQPQGTQKGTEQPTDWEAKYKTLQANFTRAKQQESEERKLTDEEIRVAQDKAALKALDVMTMQDYELLEKKKADLARLDTLLSQRPDLSAYKELIVLKGDTTNDSWEDIISKLPKAPVNSSNAPIVGDRSVPNRGETIRKPFSEYTPEEWAAEKKRQMAGKKLFR